VSRHWSPLTLSPSEYVIEKALSVADGSPAWHRMTPGGVALREGDGRLE
jgi:hypothetical protein